MWGRAKKKVLATNEPSAEDTERRNLSDSLGVSSAIHLGMADMLKLKAVLDAPDSAAHVDRALTRLAMVPMTAKLERATGVVAMLAELLGTPQLRAAVVAGDTDAIRISKLIELAVGKWGSQLEEERRAQQQKQDDAAAAVAAREAAAAAKRVKDPTCPACQGRHRPHTCARAER